MKPHLLMIEDDQRLANMVTTWLGQNGFQVSVAENAQQGLALLRQIEPALVLLDLMLPDADGLDVCRQIRSMGPVLGQTPIVMLTAKGDPMDRVLGLELGADDYLPKPFEPRELLARLRAVLRRPPMNQAPAPAMMANPVAPTADSNTLRFGRLEIDSAARSVRLDGQERTLTAYQFDLLLAMAERAGRVLSREALFDAVNASKGGTLDAFDRSIDVHIGRLRASLEDDPKNPKRIITVRGAGYVFTKVQDA
jgi:DNA-binding response OmpR family regulator